MTAAADNRLEHAPPGGPDVPAWAATCLNCGSSLSGPFCSACGQHAMPPHPSVHELLQDALEQFAHWDGKVAETVRCLIARPGALTSDVLAGRRARYIPPLRLYLTCSLIYFLFAAAVPSRGAIISVSSSPAGANKVQVAGPASDLTEEERAQILGAAEKAPPLMRPLVRRVVEDPRGFQRDMLEALPRVLFALLPVFAGILALFYHRRRFVEHLYFALHLHAFMFLALCASPLARLTHSVVIQIAVDVGLLVWIPVYAHLAFRRVYGNTHLATMLKETGVSVLYGVATIPAVLVAAIWVGSRPH